ncbi:polyketide cyclase/dehydrase/lipid transport protein [Motilibacter rhizosphaerae]|uniref:Polyketide cyclase/dehydrase/lipid transport protein n=1 Tax=Motilibacter rhizosphaerae TaxID=598652 RepID=A0A4Q7NWN6_9ACTN|nr:SRPBCC family protein [Motilibacter rhizosphaerae]RZS91733.1 polyketide cyclase/dehydrase/lipid transport protein [Motilibacter rhizosphaerae]
MIEIARLSVRSTARPEQLYARWADVETHPDWAPGMEYLRLEAPIAKGVRGVCRARGRDEQVFVITDLVPGTTFEDSLVLDGAHLRVRHEALPVDGGSEVTLHAVITGPEAPARAAEFEGLAEALEGDLLRLVALVEGRTTT